MELNLPRWPKLSCDPTDSVVPAETNPGSRINIDRVVRHCCEVELRQQMQEEIRSVADDTLLFRSLNVHAGTYDEAGSYFSKMEHVTTNMATFSRK